MNQEFVIIFDEKKNTNKKMLLTISHGEVWGSYFIFDSVRDLNKINFKQIYAVHVYLYHI